VTGPAERPGPQAPVKRDPRGRFLPGHPGLRRGSRDIGPVDFRDALQADWEEHGPRCIERLRLRNPERYLLIMIGIVPRRWGGKGR
jgi:hypothetical protein